MARIQLRRGLKAAQPTTGMLAGEPHIHTDRGTMAVAIDAVTSIGVVPAIEDLTAIGVVAGAADLLIMHDASSLLEKKILFNDFKTALNIPPGSTDELVAVVAGGTAGYIWGTDGTDGILQMNSSMSWTKDAGDGFVTLAVATVDGGTF